MRYYTFVMIRRLVGISLFCVFMLSCAAKPLSQFEVRHPARLTINKNIKKVFIDPSKIRISNDMLGIKNLVIKKLQERLNQFGRFKVVVGPVHLANPEKDIVGLIQGDIISGEQVEDAQFTEVATCKGGVTGFASGITAAGTSAQGITVSRRGLLCISSDSKAEAVGSLFAMAGLDLTSGPVDEVVRVYKVKNIAIFAQLNLSLTEIGKKREMVAIRSDSASFGRQVVKSARNVHETYLTASEALPLLISPITPLFVRRYAVVDATNRGTWRGKWIEYLTPTASSIPPEERSQVIGNLVTESLKPFIRTISPYRVKAYIQIAESGNQDVVELIKKGEWQKARVELAKISPREPADEYNYGLTFEGGAESADDFREAKKYYLSALNMEPSNIMYAQGVGRMERRLKEAKKIQEQTKL